MSPESLAGFANSLVERHDSYEAKLQSIGLASPDAPSTDLDADALTEAIFLRFFIEYEADLERLFLHYVTDGVSLSGVSSVSFLAVKDESHARKLVRAGFRFLSWAKPDSIRETSSHYLKNGWPLVDVLVTKTQDLNDCEKVRNRIAHKSIESESNFLAVQRNLFQTERMFAMSPGHLLRCRYRKKSKSVIQHYHHILHEILEALIDPPQ
jgi:hypothetical protein